MMRLATYADYKSLWAALELGPDQCEIEFARLKVAYSVPGRKYHTLNHIGWCLDKFDELLNHRGVDDWRSIAWAIWYHDLYCAGGPIDEQDSASAAKRILEVFGKSKIVNVVDRIYPLILATRHDKVPLTEDCALICDVDLSIFGAAPDVYDQYETLIREEYSHVPVSLFAQARVKILERFRHRPTIYYTSTAREFWEDQATSNLTRAVENLYELSDSGC